jgi:hypothetical protein
VHFLEIAFSMVLGATLLVALNTLWVRVRRRRFTSRWVRYLRDSVPVGAVLVTARGRSGRRAR